MQLNKTHREALLTNLIEAKDELEMKRLLRDKQTADFKEWRDIKLFLLIERVKFIERCLIDNEIDF